MPAATVDSLCKQYHTLKTPPFSAHRTGQLSSTIDIWSVSLPEAARAYGTGTGRGVVHTRRQQVSSVRCLEEHDKQGDMPSVVGLQHATSSPVHNNSSTMSEQGAIRMIRSPYITNTNLMSQARQTAQGSIPVWCAGWSKRSAVLCVRHAPPIVTLACPVIRECAQGSGDV
jgi:hypothetical protein